jgi:sugar phosphate isomerase/epimerase
MTDLALSSYWMRGRWERVSDFFQAGVDSGFRSFEVSGLRSDTFYDEIHPGQFNIVSFHSPAPPRHGASDVMESKEMCKFDIVLTSLDRERRQQAVTVVQRCIDVASEYGSQAVVLHLGRTGADPDLASRLGRLFLDGEIASPQADAIRSRLTVERARQHEERMLALMRSLDELVPYASPKGVRLGLENRPICEVPSFDDVGQVLLSYPDDTVGYWHDTGHAQVQADLGITPHADWLHAYGHRLIGLHVHDAVNLQVHQAPGTGSVDWASLAWLVPIRVPRIVEVDHTVSEKALLAGVGHLQSTGWV